VTKNQINIIELQARKRAIDAFDESLTIQGVLFVYIIVQAPVELG
jgi:hypothetical protein